MAHQLSIREDGFVEMAYVGSVPWHHLGNQLPANASKAQWRKAAGYDHDILAEPVSYTVGGETYTVTDRMMMYRSDNKRPLGVVSSDYKIVQPSEVLSFFDDLIEAVGLKLETAGTLFGGKHYWVLAKIGEEAVLGTDQIKGYLLLSTSADGSRRTVAKGTSVRVVCDNTLCLSDNPRYNTGGIVEVSHRSVFDAALVKEQLGVAPKSFQQFMANLDVLAKKRLRTPTAQEMTETVFGEDSRAVPKVMELFGGEALGYDMPGFAGTTWGWINSVTEYVDHKTHAKTDSHRISNSLMGKGDQRKREAFKLALEYAG